LISVLLLMKSVKNEGGTYKEMGLHNLSDSLMSNQLVLYYNNY